MTGDGVRLMFDYGWYSWGLNPEDGPEHEYLVSYEDIGGLRAKLLLPVKSPSGAAADYSPAIGVYFQDLGGASFNLIGRGLTPDQQRVAVGISAAYGYWSRLADAGPVDNRVCLRICQSGQGIR